MLDNDIWSAHSIAQWISNSSPHFNVLWYSRNPADAIHRCLFALDKPDVLILDMALGSMSGTSVCMYIRRQTPHIGIIGITAYSSEYYKDDLAAAGAQALISKEFLTDSLPAIIPTVAQGNSPNPECFRTAQQAYEMFNKQETTRSIPQLSEREMQIIRLYSQNNTTAAIAQQCGISTNSVFTYIHRVQQKLGTHNRAETIKICQKYGLI